MTTIKALPLIHAPWLQYSAQVLEKACEENRLEELLTELVCDIINNSSISDEIKFETGCRAICMIPPQQSAFIKKISAAFKVKGFWALAKSSLPAFKHNYNQALLQAQKEAVMRKNLSAALKLISKSEFVQKSLTEAVLNYSEKVPDAQSYVKDMLEAIDSLPKDEVKEVLRSTISLMDLFKDDRNHAFYIEQLALVRKGNRSDLVEKLSQMHPWKPRFESTSYEIFFRLLNLTSKLSPVDLTQEVFNVLFRFEKARKDDYEDHSDACEEILKLPSELFSQLSFYHTHEMIDVLGQKGLKVAVEIAKARGGVFGLGHDSEIVKEAILKDPSIIEQALERLRFRLEHGKSKNEQRLAADMIRKLFTVGLHSDEGLALKAISETAPELSPEHAKLFLYLYIPKTKVLKLGPCREPKLVKVPLK